MSWYSKVTVRVSLINISTEGQRGRRSSAWVKGQERIVAVLSVLSRLWDWHVTLETGLVLSGRSVMDSACSLHTSGFSERCSLNSLASFCSPIWLVLWGSLQESSSPEEAILSTPPMLQALLTILSDFKAPYANPTIWSSMLLGETSCFLVFIPLFHPVVAQGSWCLLYCESQGQRECSGQIFIEWIWFVNLKQL